MMSLPAEPPTPPTRTSEALRSELKEVNEQLDAMKRSWDHVTEMRDVGVMLTSPYVSDLHSSTCSEGAFG